jgi:hypothetical protein
MGKKTKTSFKPGNCANPNGRPPKGEALTDVLKSKVDKEAIAEKLIEIALEKGDITALKYIYDRIDGTPTQTIKQQITEENPIHDMIRELVYGPEPETETVPDGE